MNSCKAFRIRMKALLLVSTSTKLPPITYDTSLAALYSQLSASRIWLATCSSMCCYVFSALCSRNLACWATAGCSVLKAGLAAGSFSDSNKEESSTNSEHSTATNTNELGAHSQTGLAI